MQRSFAMQKRLTLLVAFLLAWTPDVYLFGTTHGKSAIDFDPNLQIATLIINEYQADPADGPAGDANGDGTRSASQDEFIELVNTGSLPLDVSGFTISDAAQVRFTFPQGKIIPVGEAAVIFGGGTPTGMFGNAGNNRLVFAVGGSGLNLNNGADSIIVKDHSGVEVVRRDYPSADGSANQSLTRSPDISGNFMRHSQVAESSGALFSPGTKINGEPFTVAPAVDRINPQSLLESENPFDLAVEGANFHADSLVLINFVVVATAFVSDTNLMATVPATVAAVPGNYRVEVRNPDGNHSNFLTLHIIPLPPVLTALIPTVIEVGTGSFPLFLQGANFTSASVVLINDASVTTSFINKRELRATVSSSLTNVLGVKRVRVRNPDGKVSREFAFEIVAKRPRITSLNPPQLLIGSPPFSLEARGTNFSNRATLVFDSTPLPTEWVSSTTLKAQVSAELIAGVGLKAITVQNPDGAISNEVAFRVVPDMPLIKAMTPDAAVEGSDEKAVQLFGEKFKEGARVFALTDLQTSIQLDSKFISVEHLEVSLKSELLATAKNLALRVENPDFGFSNEAIFKVFIKDPLVINEYLADPPDDLTGDANGDGIRSSSQDEFVEIVNRTSEPLDISGYKLSDSETVRHLFSAGTTIPPFEAAIVFGGGTPKGAFGNAADNGLVFAASSGGLSLNNGGDSIKFEDAQGQLIQEIKFTTVEGNANESFNREPDAGGAGFSRHTAIINGNHQRYSPGTKATGEAFTIKPIVNELLPARIQAKASDFTLKIMGANFDPAAEVLFANQTLSANVLSSTELEVIIPAELLIEVGFVDVRVRNPKGELSKISRFLIIGDPPRIASITPEKTGTGAENLEVNILGESFQHHSIALINNEKIETRFISPTSMLVIAPAKFFTTAGEIEIKIVNADETQSNPFKLTIENGPLITRLSRKKIKAGSGAVPIKISGVAFKSDVVLFVNHRAVQTSFTHDGEFNATIPVALTEVGGTLELQARHADGGRSNRVKIKVVD
jgi:hypothetical protein